MEKDDLVMVHARWINDEDEQVNYGALMRLDRLAQLVDLMDQGTEPPEADE